jgi:predicted house-cleaning noncanonical NTP pyrophosphatase (MazG superfamily)
MIRVLIIILCLASGNLLAQSTQPATPEKSRVINDESWYAILLKGEKIGTMHTAFYEETITSTNTSEKFFLFSRAISITKSSFLTYLALNEETYFSSDNLLLQKLYVSLSLLNKDEIILKGNRDDGRIKLSIIKNEQTPKPQSYDIHDENLYSEQLLGIAMIKNNWAVNQSYPLRIINPYNPTNFITDAHLMIKEKSSQEIMGINTGGFICSLLILDLKATVKEIEYFISPQGIILKQIMGDINIIKITKEETVSPIASKRVFEQKGRLDPFTVKMTPIKKETQKPLVSKTPEPKLSAEEKQILSMLQEAEEQLNLMKKIYETTLPEKRDKPLVSPYQKILDIYDRINKGYNISAKEKIAIIREEAERFFAGAEKIYAQAQFIRNESQNDFDSRDLMSLKKMPEKLSRISELANRPEVKDTEYQPKIKKLVDEVAEFARRAKIIEEFFTSLPVIKGILYHLKSQEIKLLPLVIHFLGSELSLPLSYFIEVPDSVVIIGNNTYREGDSISEHLIIKKILENGVIFQYKKEDIIITK